LEFPEVPDELLFPVREAYGIGGMKRDQISPVVFSEDFAMMTGNLDFPVKHCNARRVPEEHDDAGLDDRKLLE
jgi:hypothetical protein